MTPSLRPGNHILRAMAQAGFERLHPALKTVRVEKGATLSIQGRPVETVYFPTDAVLGNVVEFSDGSAVETAAVGRDSVTGLAAVFAHAPLSWSVRVQVAGEVVAMPAEHLRRAMDADGDLRALLLRVIYDAQSQAAMTAACNAEHEVIQRLSKWLLMLLDRTDGTTVTLTQNEIAVLLGTERTSVNVALQALKDRGGISISRGSLTLLDHAVLERLACECYMAQRAWTRTLGLPVEPDRLPAAAGA